MEKLRLTLIYIAMLLPALAMAVSPGEVENVQLRDSRRYVSDMAGVLSPQALERADSILADIRSRTSAEVVM
ncbi:MAG: TPM domain-containing protein, partial [Muribaculaceae bacterium]|nr:TPM domain-containing protein [Muribaculaceae bacterium]